MSKNNINPSLFLDDEFEEVKLTPEKVVCLGMEFESEDARRAYFREELRKKLPELKQIEGFPIGDDDDIINLSDPPYYTACPNPWLNDFIAEWEKETGKQATVALSATKDVQDAILNDPKRAAVVDIIDIRYWHYRTDGTTYAPEGGKNLAPRQHARKMPVGKMGYKEAYKAVSEYRTKYPDKAVLLYAQNYPDYGWAVLMGGGSCPVLHVDDERFLKDVPYMNVVPTDTDDYEMIASEDRGAVLNVHKAVELHIDLPSGKYALKYIDPESCKVTVLTQKMKVKDRFDLKTLKKGVYWLQRL